MCLPDTAEYWWDIKNNKGYFPRPQFTHIKGRDCGHFHKSESVELSEINCHACKKIIENEPDLKHWLFNNDSQRKRKVERKRRLKKGYKLDSTLKFGKFKGRTISYIISNEPNYWKWVSKIILVHPEVDEYIK